MFIYFQDKLEICDKSFHKTDEGFLVLDGIISRSGVQDYLGVELGLDHMNVVSVDRPVSEVSDAMSFTSFLNKPVTDNHPSNGNIDSSNARELSRGMVTDVSVTDSGHHIKAKMLITDQELIRKIESGKRELSAGYKAQLSFSDDGKTATQTKIRGNHVAFVDQARCGRECKIFDSKRKLNEGNDMLKVLINGIQYEIADSAAVAVKSVLDANEALEAKTAKVIADMDSLQGKFDASLEEVKTLKDSVINESDITALAEKLTALHTSVAMLDSKFDCKGKTVTAVQRAIVDGVLKVDFKDKSDAYVEARFDALVDAAKVKAKDPLTNSLSNLNDGGDEDPKAVTDAARVAYIDRSKKRYLGSAGQNK